ncbi:MAG: sigma-70 family RNA polymerase sigma factor [Lentisphaeria bacterium]|nr:sigma-70 family RNA polymerase sigma factor [Lentisphaeria bacterium]
MTDIWATRKTLIQRVRDKHDHESWEEFVDVYKQFLYVVVRNLNLNHHDTEEIVQEVFLKTWNHLEKFDYQPGKGKFRHWLSRIAKNTVVDFARKRKAQANRVEKASNNADSPFSHNGISSPDIESFVEQEWIKFITERAFEKLSETTSPKEIETFHLFAKGKSVTEISETLGIAESSVYVYKKRIQEKLQKEIKNLEYDLG